MRRCESSTAVDGSRATTCGSGGYGDSLLASLIASGTVRPGRYAGSEDSTGRSFTVTGSPCPFRSPCRVAPRALHPQPTLSRCVSGACGCKARVSGGGLSVGAIIQRSQVAAQFLLPLDGLEQRLEVALAEAERAVPLDQLEEDRRPVAERLGEDLQQVAVLVPVDQDAARFFSSSTGTRTWPIRARSSGSS